MFMTLGSGKATARPMISLQWLYFIFFARCGKEGSRCKLVAPLHRSLCYDFRPAASRPFSHSKKSKWSDFSPRFFTYAEPISEMVTWCGLQTMRVSTTPNCKKKHQKNGIDDYLRKPKGNMLAEHCHWAPDSFSFRNLGKSWLMRIAE